MQTRFITRLDSSHEFDLLRRISIVQLKQIDVVLRALVQTLCVLVGLRE